MADQGARHGSLVALSVPSDCEGPIDVIRYIVLYGCHYVIYGTEG
jgi:hypothetical protein